MNTRRSRARLQRLEAAVNSRPSQDLEAYRHRFCGLAISRRTPDGLTAEAEFLHLEVLFQDDDQPFTPLSWRNPETHPLRSAVEAWRRVVEEEDRRISRVIAARSQTGRKD
jgi:hypothetical protein